MVIHESDNHDETCITSFVYYSNITSSQNQIMMYDCMTMTVYRFINIPFSLLSNISTSIPLLIRFLSSLFLCLQVPFISGNLGEGNKVKDNKRKMLPFLLLRFRFVKYYSLFYENQLLFI